MSREQLPLEFLTSKGSLYPSLQMSGGDVAAVESRCDTGWHQAPKQNAGKEAGQSKSIHSISNKQKNASTSSYIWYSHVHFNDSAATFHHTRRVNLNLDGISLLPHSQRRTNFDASGRACR